MPAIYPVFEQKIESADNFAGHSLSRSLEELDAIAANLGLTPISQFIDSHTMAADFFDEGEMEGIEIPTVQWHDAAKGLATVKGLYDYFQADSDTSNGVLDDLHSLIQLLEKAVALSTGFHLLVDI